MMLYYFTNNVGLEEIEKTTSITSTFQTLFTPAPTGVYLTPTNPQDFRYNRSFEYLSCFVEIDIPEDDPFLTKCAPYDRLEIYFYEKNINLSEWKWRGGINSSWEVNKGVLNWKMAIGAAAVGVGAVVIGKVVYDKIQENKNEKKKIHQDKLLSLGWEEGVGKKGSRQGTSNDEKFIKLGKKEVKNLPAYEPPIEDDSVSDFVSSFEYMPYKDSRESFTKFVNNVKGKINFGSDEPDDTEPLDMEESFEFMEGPKMSQIFHLEQMYNTRVRIEESEQKKYLSLMKNIVGRIIQEMKERSQTFNVLYKETYFGGSVFDGLKVNSTGQEFDLNIIFKCKAKDVEVVGLGHDSKRKNFCFLKVSKTSNQFEDTIVNTDDYGTHPGTKYLSPVKMFDLLKSSVDKVLTREAQSITHQGNMYRVTRHEFAPVTLKVVSLDSFQPVSFEIDLVPSIKLDLEALKENKVKDRIANFCEEFGVSKDMRSFMAISLHKADKHKFEVDFHDVERKILFNRGCTKKVIKLMKFLRDSKGGPAEKLWSHLLKTSVMHHVLRTPVSYWNNANLEKCFIDSLRNLLEGLREDNISDIFFTEVNLLDRIKTKQVKKDCTIWLEKILRKYDRTGRVMDIFS